MTHRLFYLALMTAMASSTSSAAEVTPELPVGAKLPELRADYLSGREALLPKDSSGKVALLLFGFTYQSRFAVEAWTKQFRKDFEKTPQVTFYEIPMIGGLARLGKWFIDGGMRRGTPKTDHENVITVYGGTDACKRRLAFKVEDAAYLVLLDQSGTVVWRHAGPFEEAPYEALAAQVRKLVSGQ